MTPEFVHQSRYGCLFSASKLDLSDGVDVLVPSWIWVELESGEVVSAHSRLASDITEFAAFHAIHVHPRLNGFSGYDNIDYDFKSDESEI